LAAIGGTLSCKEEQWEELSLVRRRVMQLRIKNAV
jgi:hypothetical protein